MSWRSSIYEGAIRISKRAQIPLIIGALTVLPLTYFWSESRPSVVLIHEAGDQISFETRQKDLSAALIEQGITWSKSDRVIPALSTALRPAGAVTVHIQRAIPVNLLVDGTDQQVQTLATSVGELLMEQAITLGEKDTVSADQEMSIVPGMSIKVTRRSEITRVRTVEIPFHTMRKEDQSLVVGETKELQSGSVGLQEVTELIALEDGREIEVTLTSEITIKPPVDRILVYGTVGVVSRSGTEYRYTRELQLTATGYTAGQESNPNGNGYTYTGMKAVRGVVAVDPQVIPLYTRLYIEGYGPAVAADIGGAIKGNRIDLCFTTVEEALQWGIRPAKVYVLTD